MVWYRCSRSFAIALLTISEASPGKFRRKSDSGLGSERNNCAKTSAVVAPGKGGAPAVIS